jgi:hypothetical protein
MSELSKEALEYLIESGEEHAEIETIDVPDQHRRVLVKVPGENGVGYMWVDKDPPLMTTEHTDIASFSDFVKENASSSGAAIFVNPHGVRAVLDVVDRRERATLELRKTTGHDRVMGLITHGGSNPGPEYNYTPRQLCLTLLELGCTEPQIVPFRAVKFSSSANANHINTPVSSGLGSDVEAQAVGSSTDLPESVMLNTALYCGEGLDMDVNIPIQIFVNAAEQAFGLFVRTEHYYGAVDAVMESIRKKLHDSDTEAPVYLGYPGNPARIAYETTVSRAQTATIR